MVLYKTTMALSINSINKTKDITHNTITKTNKKRSYKYNTVIYETQSLTNNASENL